MPAWPTTDNLVLGHTCDGLRKWQQEDRSCELMILDDGRIASCDAESDMAISFCPFCGLKLGG